MNKLAVLKVQGVNLLQKRERRCTSKICHPHHLLPCRSALLNLNLSPAKLKSLTETSLFQQLCLVIIVSVVNLARNPFYLFLVPVAWFLRSIHPLFTSNHPGRLQIINMETYFNQNILKVLENSIVYRLSVRKLFCLEIENMTIYVTRTINS